MSNSLDTFQRKLTSNEYASLTGAKRAIGKFKEMSDKDRDKARELADSHFAGGAISPSATAKKSPAKKSDAQKSALAAKKSGASKKGQVTVTTSGSSVGPGKGRMAKKAVTKGSRGKAASGRAQEHPTPAQELSMATGLIGTMEQAVSNAKRVQELDVNVDITNVLELAVEGIEAAQRTAMGVVGLEPRPRHPVQPAPAVEPTNGAAVKSTVTMPGAPGLPAALPQG